LIHQRLQGAGPAPHGWAWRLPAHLLNGFSVSLGMTLTYLLVHLFAGPAAAVAASAGAVYASVADVALPPGRTWRRVLTAALIGWSVSVLIAFLRSSALAIALALAAIGFLSTLSLAWGPRAGPISFVGLLCFVFSMAAPPIDSTVGVLRLGAWIGTGGALYLAWSMLAATCLQARYRSLALADAVGAASSLLRARSAFLMRTPRPPWATAAMLVWIVEDSLLDDRLQLARDHLFAAPDGPEAQRQNAILLLVIDLRDSLQLGQLDLEAIGEDAPAAQVRMAVGSLHGACADILADAQRTIALGGIWRRSERASQALEAMASAASFADHDLRGTLLPVLVDRSRHLVADIDGIQRLLCGSPPQESLSARELQLFVSLDGWPLAALRPHLRLASPILRHALRATIALSAAYAIGRALPWASHPHWLVLSVAVVLRGSLEQTLARRNQRIAGTLAGCMAVLLISHFATHVLSMAVYLGATGLSHAYTTVRYFVTASAATVMALLQDHLANPGGHFAIVERLADTIIGAVLAWAFSYLLPAWEHRQLPLLVDRLLRALSALADHAARLPQDGGDSAVAMRLARVEAYDALRSLSAAAQRASVEPSGVRPSEQAFASLIGQSHALLAHLAAVRVLMTRRSLDLDPAQARQVMAAAVHEIKSRLLGVPGPPSDRLPLQEAALSSALPVGAPAESLMPWFRRRLAIASATAAQIADSARCLRQRASTSPGRR
jgi:uncharacterized membrane protein YccC